MTTDEAIKTLDEVCGRHIDDEYPRWDILTRGVRTLTTTQALLRNVYDDYAQQGYEHWDEVRELLGNPPWPA